MSSVGAQEPSTVTVRAATLSDSDALCALSEQLGYPAQPAEFTRRLIALLNAPDQHVVLVAVEGARIVGFAHVLHVPLLVMDAAAQLAGLVVDSALRCRGIGEKLMIAAEAWAQSCGCHCLYLKSNVLRTRAHPFYERLGYHREKTQYSFTKPLRP